MRRIPPAALLFLGYALISTVGGVILHLPFMHRGEVSFFDALFTATSAVCVTGLIVVDTATAWTFWGKAFLAVLIQMGGLGYMTLTALLLAAVGSKGSLSVRKMVAMSVGSLEIGGVIGLAKRIVLTALLFELLFVIPLFLAFSGDFSLPAALGHAIFHSISALNNAGFSTFSNSLMDYALNPTVNLSIAFLIVWGGIGFKVWRGIYERIRGRRRRLDLHEKLVVLSTSVLVILATLTFYTLVPQTDSVWTSLFAAITPRTAGFNTVDYSSMSPFGRFATMVLMFIGGSPGGTAGGVKTITVTLIVLWLISTLRGQDRVVAFKRTVSEGAVVKAFQTFVLAIFSVLTFTLILLLSEREVVERVGFLNFSFEVISAFGTVGLSTGSLSTPNVSLSADFTPFGKALIMLAMIIGRAGYLVFAASLIRTRPTLFKYAEEEVVV